MKKLTKCILVCWVVFGLLFSSVVVAQAETAPVISIFKNLGGGAKLSARLRLVSNTTTGAAGAWWAAGGPSLAGGLFYIGAMISCAAGAHWLGMEVHDWFMDLYDGLSTPQPDTGIYTLPNGKWGGVYAVTHHTGARQVNSGVQIIATGTDVTYNWYGLGCCWYNDSKLVYTRNSNGSTTCGYMAEELNPQYIDNSGGLAVYSQQSTPPTQVAFEQAVQEHVSEIVANPLVSVVTPDTAPASGVSYDVPSIDVDYSLSSGPVVDPVTQVETDPYTGNEAAPVTDPDLGTYTQPNQWQEKALDTDVLSPLTEEQKTMKSIPDLVTGWLSNLPLLSMFRSFNMQASGSCVLTATAPIVGSVSLDFCQFAWVWDAIKIVVLAMAHISAMLIILRG